MGAVERREPGEIQECAALVRAHKAALTADLREFYQVRLLDLFTGGLTWDELYDLIHGLPGHSRFQTELRDAIGDEKLMELAAEQDGHGRWSHLDFLVARLIDAVNANTHVQMQMNTEKTLPLPEPVRRPGIPDPEKKRVARIEDQMAKHAARAARREAALAARRTG